MTTSQPKSGKTVLRSDWKRSTVVQEATETTPTFRRDSGAGYGQVASMSDLTTTAAVLGRLVETELQSEFWWVSREELAERRETLISFLERRFAACFARELIRQVAAIQVDQFSALKD